MTSTTHSFQTETKQILDLMIHSLYSHKEIFLRELISNASDAIEKLKLESLTHENLKSFTGTDFKITIETHPDQKTLIIHDNGIGMSEEEIIKNLGTIAHSGTKAFLSARQKQTDPCSSQKDDMQSLIGQFGVGFYSSFMVAEHVTVLTQKAGTTKAIQWDSSADGTYTLSTTQRPEGHGTSVILKLKTTSAEPTSENTTEDTISTQEQDFTDPYLIKSLVKKYSDFIAFPIILLTDKSKEGKKELTPTHEVLNSQIALWQKSALDVTAPEYNELYKNITHDWQEPYKVIHFKAEGTSEFSSILFIPQKKPMQFSSREFKSPISLYVKRVLIQSETDFLVPLHFRFISGIVDSSDLPLNVSRETLQHNVQISKIRKALTNKIISTLRDILEKDRSSYETFWKEFGTTLKEGVEVNSTNSFSDIKKLQELFLFHSTEKENTTLKEVVTRMHPNQQSIYYISGENFSQLKNSPYLEKLTSKGFEVLLLTDRVDVWMLSNMSEFDGKKFTSISSDKLDLSSSEEEKKQEEQDIKTQEEHFKTLISNMEKSLTGSVTKVRISDRLTDSAVCLVASGPYDAHTERLIKAMGQQVHTPGRILEINPKHPIFEKMLLLPESIQKDWSELLYQQALLNEGSMIENPNLYSKKITELLMASI